MRILAFEHDNRQSIGVRLGSEVVDLAVADPALPRDMISLIAGGADMLAAVARAGEHAKVRLPLSEIRHCLPIAAPDKYIGLGLNYLQHLKEMDPSYPHPDFPGMFMRVPSSMVAHGAPIIRPTISDTLDYEGELMVVIGRPGRHITEERALDHVFGYTCHNDGSIREFNARPTSLTAGKNFDRTGGMGPEIVTDDELPPGCRGLRLRTRVNGETRQDASLSDMHWGVAALISLMSRMMLLRPGDLISTGTPPGVGAGFRPPKFLTHGDSVDVEIEGVGVLSNPIVDEAAYHRSSGPPQQYTSSGDAA